MNTSRAETDEVLWTRAVLGDGLAFAAVFERRVDAVYGHCLRRCASPTEAQDLTSLVFLEAWRKRRSVRFVDGSALPWLIVVATNVARNEQRARRRFNAALTRLHGQASATVEPVDDEAITKVDGDAEAVAVRRALTALSERDQQVLALCDMTGLTYEAAAAQLQIPVGTVRSRLSRARDRLAEQLRGTGTFPDSHHSSLRADRRVSPEGGTR